MTCFQGTVISSSPVKEVYNPKTFILHAALLRQGFPHCAIFPTAASRRSLGRVSVPMWPINLSVRLLIVALVSRYLTNKLIRRGPLFPRIAPLIPSGCPVGMLCGISTSFPVLSPTIRQVAHALLTRPPLFRSRRSFTVRLECVMHAASVHPEPGSNSLKNCISTGFPRIDPISQSKIFSLNYFRASLNSKEFSESFVHRCCSIFNELPLPPVW